MKLLACKVARQVLALVLLLSAGVLAAFLYPFPLSSENTTIDVMHMQYACGDCYVQYRVLKAGMDAQTGVRTFITRMTLRCGSLAGMSLFYTRVPTRRCSSTQTQAMRQTEVVRAL